MFLVVLPIAAHQIAACGAVAAFPIAFAFFPATNIGRALGIFHFALTVGLALSPIAAIDAAIGIGHRAFPVSAAFDHIAFIGVAAAIFAISKPGQASIVEAASATTTTLVMHRPLTRHFAPREGADIASA